MEGVVQSQHNNILYQPNCSLVCMTRLCLACRVFFCFAVMGRCPQSFESHVCRQLNCIGLVLFVNLFLSETELRSLVSNSAYVDELTGQMVSSVASLYEL